MTFLPNTSLLGKLDMIEVYEVYDKPVLFACRNASNTIFLAILVDENEQEDRWLYVSISFIRFTHVRSGSIDLHNAFLHAEDGIVFDVRISHVSDEPDRVLVLPVDQLNDDLLPAPGEILRYETPTLPVLEQDIERKAQQANREYLELAFDFGQIFRTEAPAHLLGRLLEAVQNTINAIGEALAGEPNRSGPIPNEILNQNRLVVTGFSHGSFIVELASSGYINLFGETEVGAAIEQFINLMNAGSDTEALRSRLIELKPRVSSHYIEFLEALNEGNVNTRVIWGSPSPDRGGRVALSQVTAKIAKDYILAYEEQSVRQFDVIGVLIGANTRTRRYEIETPERKYAGDILDSAFVAARTATLSQTYIATLREVIDYKPFTGSTATKYQLALLHPYTPAEIPA